jgi:predicted nucleotidyltransferase component of viral defense system
MIPEAYIQEWRESAPWRTLEMVEQDLILSRALDEIFSDRTLSTLLAFRGGTALHKLYFSSPQRYSEDIDLVQKEGGSIGPVYDGIQAVLNPWMGLPSRRRGPDVANLTYRMDSEFPPSVRLQLKIEINTRDHFAVDGFVRRQFDVSSRWYTGSCQLTTYTLDELLGTKMRALFQRRKGRDVFDLWLGLTEGGADPDRVVAVFRRYMEAEERRISRQEFMENLATKRVHPGFLSDVGPLLVPEANFDMGSAVDIVESELVSRL